MHVSPALLKIKSVILHDLDLHKNKPVSCEDKQKPSSREDKPSQPLDLGNNSL